MIHKLSIDWISTDEEDKIRNYRNLYLRNNKVSQSKLYELIKKLDVLKTCNTRFDKKRILNDVSKEVVSIIYDSITLKTLEMFTAAYLKTQKGKEFDRLNPFKKGTSDTMQALINYTRSQSKERYCKISETELIESEYEYKRKYLFDLCNCIGNFGLKNDLIEKRGDMHVRFNFYIEFISPDRKLKKEAINLLDEIDLKEHYIDPYNSGSSIMVNGYEIERSTIKKTVVSTTKYNKEELLLYASKKGHRYKESSLISRVWFFKECKDVTKDYFNTKNSILNSTTEYYVFSERLAELKAIRNSNFDLAKLITLCEELNKAKKNDMRFSQASLVRMICDHVPPMFDSTYRGFEQVASNYRSERNAQSFKGAVKRLFEFFKHVADGGLHSQARRTESMPTKELVDFSKELDYLLQEVCRILK
jgi:hypothetical protein